MRQGEHVMTVCNACRYCEQYCPVFPALENRLTFAKGDLTYLANLCHNCGECLYSCQYAPPHEFGINVPRTLSEIRVLSYEEYCWPRPLGAAFRRHGVATSLALSIALTAVMLAAARWFGTVPLWTPDARGNFYAVLPHHVMVTLFGGVFLFVAAALAIGVRRFWRDVSRDSGGLHANVPDANVGADLQNVGADLQVGPSFRIGHTAMASGKALRDVLTLRHLQTDGVDCTHAEEERRPWRRWFHHCTFYGFMACFASTSVAAVYHVAFGWRAPYGYTSLPVVLGTIGGLGLLVGPVGLFVIARQRDRELGDPTERGMDVSFITLLFLTSLTGLLLLVFRNGAVMGPLLIVHLGVVLALFVTLPYGKFVHGIYRAAALVKYARDTI
jgi:citrate/tricarballylate utilization protein